MGFNRECNEISLLPDQIVSTWRSNLPMFKGSQTERPALIVSRERRGTPLLPRISIHKRIYIRDSASSSKVTSGSSALHDSCKGLLPFPVRQATEARNTSIKYSQGSWYWIASPSWLSHLLMPRPTRPPTDLAVQCWIRLRTYSPDSTDCCAATTALSVDMVGGPTSTAARQRIRFATKR